MRELRADGATVKSGYTVLSAYGHSDIASKDGIVDLCLDIGREYARLYIEVAISLSLADESALEMLCDIEKSVPLTLKDLKISGGDLSKIGFVGIDLGKALASLLRDAAHGKIKNEKDELLSVARKTKK